MRSSMTPLAATKRSLMGGRIAASAPTITVRDAARQFLAPIDRTVRPETAEKPDEQPDRSCQMRPPLRSRSTAASCRALEPLLDRDRDREPRARKRRPRSQR